MRVVSGQRVVSQRPKGNEDPGPDWLLISLLRELTRAEPRYRRIRQYLEGDPPKPDTPDSVQDSWREFEAFRKKARTNFAHLVVAAVVDRTHIVGFRTAAAGDEDGDIEAEKLWKQNRLDQFSQEATADALGYGSGYLEVDTQAKRVKHYRPWQAMVIEDSVGDPIAAVALEHNPLQARDYAYLWTRDLDDSGIGTGNAYLHIAVRDRENAPHQGGTFGTEVPLGTYVGQRWVWWKTIDCGQEELPLYRFKNWQGVGEFEDHTDVLDRINHMLLQRVVIATMQAFKQRALKGEFPEFDKDGKRIDWNAAFPADPGALWILPPEADLWESGQTSIQDILAAVKDDVRDLAATTRTPMTYFSPDSANGSAEGAELQREGYTSKVDDRKLRFEGTWRSIMATLFRVNNDPERATPEEIEVIWSPTKELSLSERYSAFAQASGEQSLPLRTIMREVLHYTPKQMRAAEIERLSQILTSAAATPPGSGGQSASSSASLTPLGRSAAGRQQMEKTNGATSRSTGVSA